LDEILDGTWYQQSWPKLVYNPIEEYVAPIVGYMDKTGTDKYQRNGLEPFIFTLAVL